jgi:hypothetical protein
LIRTFVWVLTEVALGLKKTLVRRGMGLVAFGRLSGKEDHTGQKKVKSSAQPKFLFHIEICFHIRLPVDKRLYAASIYLFQ